VGVYISKKIKKRGKILSIIVELSIENYIGKINSINPGILVLIDCLEMKADPGTFKIVEISKIQNFVFNTHNISLKKVSDFFKMPVFILGIQPENLDFGENISYIVRKHADHIIEHINKKEVYNGCRISL
jgi:hydrogenase 3 maturation protease